LPAGAGPPCPAPPADRCPPLARRARLAGPEPTPTGRPPNEPAGAGTVPRRRTPPAPPRSPAPPPQHRFRAARPPATLGPGRLSDLPPRPAADAGSRAEEPQPDAGTSLRSVPRAAPRRAARTRRPARPGSALVAAPAAPA